MNLGDIIRVQTLEMEIINKMKKDDLFYVYLASDGFKKFIYKRFNFKKLFRNMLRQDIDKYKNLKRVGIRIPRLIAYNESENYIVREYIEGENFEELLKKGAITPEQYLEVLNNLKLIYKNNICNECSLKDFVINNDILFYIDYI